MLWIELSPIQSTSFLSLRALCERSFNQTPNDCHVLQVLVIIFPGRFHDAWKMGQAGVVYNIAKSPKADTALADVPVAVLVRAQGYLGVIQVNQKKPLKVHKTMKFLEGRVESFLG